MTTSVVNNSVFRGFFEKQKLSRPNFIEWYRQLRIVLSVEDKLDYLEQPIPPAPVLAQAGQQVALAALAAHKQELLQIVREFHACKQEEGQSVSSYVLKMKSYIDNLEHLGHAMSQNLAVQKKNNKQKKPQLDARDQNLGKGKNKQAYVPKPKISHPPKKENPAKDSICHQCGDIGHWKRNCPQYLAELLKNKKLSQGASGSVYRNNMVYFSVIPRDGIFEIDLSDSYTNNSSMYDVSNKRAKLDLDSALLWHCRLGHVSKKRIEKLQDDGLLNSTNLRAFEKCVPLWGCEALVKRDTLTKPDKLEPSSIKCIFVRYPKETIRYSFYYLPENKLIVARNAEFLENSLINQEASESLEDLKIIQEEDMNPSLYTSSHHEEDDLEIYEPQNDILPIRDLDEPANYKAALLDPESDKWLNAMNVEMQSMKDKEVWVLVDLPPNGKTVGSNWLFKKKINMDGAAHTYKACLVAKGFTQTYRVDFEETFSPVADIRAIRILIVIAAYYDNEIWQMDVKTAFLNGHLNEEVYMVQPEGFVNPKYPN
ncbi:retrovirus-related pol polyprotein from transposon TNT 1-94 [Tanacetum coccineum]